ncbi:MAG: choice-of-anchor Q domain-containing protein [Planctomycetota bacterium]
MHCRAHHVCVLIALTYLFATPGVLSARTLEVASDGRTGFASIQAAVDAAVDGDTITIQPGTYTGRGNRDINLQRKVIDIQSVDPADPGIVEATVLDCQGTIDTPQRGFRVVDFTGRISGLTITNGMASAGGAVYCENSNLVLAHCRILNNATLPGEVKTEPDGGPGGGVYCLASVVEITDCLISGNTTGAGAGSKETAAGPGGDGGGVCSKDSVVYVSDSTIADNVAGPGGNSDFFAGRGGDGGGLYCDSLVLTRTSVVRNVSGRGGTGPEGRPGGKGAGVYCKRATIDRCIIEANTAGAGGDSADAGRSAGGQGGEGAGVFCQDSLEMFDTLIAGNRTGQGGNAFDAATAGADGNGAGLWCALGLIDHCTIVGNVVAAQKSSGADSTKAATGPGAGLFCTTDTIVSNSILWANTPDQLAGQDCDNVVYCNVEGNPCLTSPGNLSADPLFVQPGNWVDPGDATMIVASSALNAVWTPGNYRLADASPCVDAADPDGVRANRNDLQGAPRLSGQAADMGAYEIQGLVPVYRFRSPKTGKYFYTPSEAEKDKLITQFAHVWTFEGIAYHVFLRPTEPGLMPVYRFWSGALASHLWTISESERDKLIQKYPDVWTFEGSAFYAYPAGKQPPGAQPVHRFWSDQLGGHFYTIDEQERQHFVDTLSHIWLYEQVAWYAMHRLFTSSPAVVTARPTDWN